MIEIAFCASRPENILTLQVWQLIGLGFAAFRGGRAISYNSVFGWLRAPFCKSVKDSSGAGDSLESKAEDGFLYAVGDCLVCPICTGTQVASLLLTVIALFPAFGVILLYVLAGAGIAEILHWVSECAEWQGRLAREQAGTEWLRKNKEEK